MQAEGRVRRPSERVGEQGSRVEEVAEEGGDEEHGGEAGCGAPEGVLVDLREAGEEVQGCGGPGQDAAGEEGGGGLRGGWGAVEGEEGGERVDGSGGGEGDADEGR